MAERKTQEQTRAERLAAELRANLKKRKARMRAARNGSGQDDVPPPERSPDCSD